MKVESGLPEGTGVAFGSGDSSACWISGVGVGVGTDVGAGVSVGAMVGVEFRSWYERTAGEITPAASAYVAPAIKIRIMAHKMPKDRGLFTLKNFLRRTIFFTCIHLQTMIVKAF